MVEEREHAATLRVLAGGPMPTPRSALDTILRRERWHVRGTGWIGDAIYGVNDGLGAVFGIVSGMAGYTGGSEVVLAAGLAGTLASALSMGAGAYLASKAQREVYESEISRERKEIEENPDEELRRARAVLPAQRVLGRRSAGDGRAAPEEAEAVSSRARAGRARPLRGDVPQSLAVDAVGDAVNGGRRVRADHSVLLHGRACPRSSPRSSSARWRTSRLARRNRSSRRARGGPAAPR